MYFKVKLGNSNNAALFVSVCSSFEPYIDYKIGRYTVDAKSIMGVLSTSLDKVATVIINTDDEHIIKSFKIKKCTQYDSRNNKTGLLQSSSKQFIKTYKYLHPNIT